MVNTQKKEPEELEKVTVYGLWPGVVGFANDADTHCVDCACTIYGREKIMAVVDGTPGYEQYTDNDGNPFNVILNDSEDADGQYCRDCGQPLFETDYWERRDTEDEGEKEVCCVCGKPAEGDTEGEVCNCVCPYCREDVFDDQTLADHGMCYDCHKKWQAGELKITED